MRIVMNIFCLIIWYVSGKSHLHQKNCNKKKGTNYSK